MLVTLAFLAAILVALALSIGPVARSDDWKATVTPLASIIGSGFLICGPLLAREFGSAAILAMAALLLLAYAVGGVVRFNILHVERIKPDLGAHAPMAWAMRIAQAMLAIAYAVSVAYYLKLLAEFAMKPFDVPAASHALIANLLVTGIILLLALLAFSGSIRKVEHAAHASVSVKLGVIAGLLVGLGAWWFGRTGAPLDLPRWRVSWHSVPLLLGLLITVQGFETSRYMGEMYDQATRIRTMRYAQWLSSAIYLAFIALLTPFLQQAQTAQGVAGILDIMETVAPALGAFVLVGAVSSQLSAAIADSIGSGGLLVEVSHKRLGVTSAFVASAALAVLVVWVTDPFTVIAWSSRAFALYYAMQALLATWASIRVNEGGVVRRVGFVVVGLICCVAAFAGAPAES